MSRCDCDFAGPYVTSSGLVVGYLYACPRCVINAMDDYDSPVWPKTTVFSFGGSIVIDRWSTNCVGITLARKHYMDKLL